MGNGTSIGRVRALGSAHTGAHHWLVQRYTAIGNLVAGLFLVISLAGLPDWTFKTMLDWLHRPLPATMLGLFVISTFWHARLGLQVLVEDYVHEHANKFASMALLNLLSFAGAAFGLLCVLRIALGS
ncbi:succinate dehydrogenase, hydrophobic membrane anchor protein [Novosphingobium sp.]|uniref:succinate dehydrogenase, hydrophobic membrane anchor protein n=1 Tax=Novosphingobium sp. TaxID=1874826 RepID=UPI0025E72A78|nr:succinate dehydrogenase, hydrophobic membrane anchor protein [Novosphingobium sp.]MCC6926935.1 succinate dehydrogenase, hydrophobic membrane anchor protein [Novosphingobium sp.]